MAAFYDVSSRRRSSWFGPNANQRMLGPTDVSPVRWRHPPEANITAATNEVDAAAPNDDRQCGPSAQQQQRDASSLHRSNASAVRSSMAASALTKAQTYAPLVIDDATWMAFSNKMKQPAALPHGWQPVSEAYDDVVQHRLWALEDGSNALLGGGRSMMGSNRRDDVGGSLPAQVPGQLGKSELRTPPPETKSPTKNRAVQEQQCNGSFHSSSAGHAMPLLPNASLGHRPMSGDPLLRSYQLRALAGGMHKWRGGVTNAGAGGDPCPSSLGGSPPSTKERSPQRPSFYGEASRALPPRASSAMALLPPTAMHHRQSDTTTTTSTSSTTIMMRPVRQRALIGVAQERISSAAARIAAVASELGSTSVKSFAGLQRVLHEKKQQEEAAAAAAAAEVEAQQLLDLATNEGRIRRATTPAAIQGRSSQRQPAASVDLWPPPPANATAATTAAPSFLKSQPSSMLVATQQGDVGATTPLARDDDGGAFGFRFLADDGAATQPIVPTEAFPFAHLLSEEDVQLLGELAGTDGVMEDAGLTHEMWSFEYDAIRNAAKAGLVIQVQEPPTDSAVATGPTGFGDGGSAGRASRRGSDNRRSSNASGGTLSVGPASTRGSVTLLGDGGPLLSGSAKTSSTLSNGSGGGVLRRISRPSVDHSSAMVVAEERPSTILERKLRALERRRTIEEMPMIALESFDVRSVTFEDRIRQVHSGAGSEASSHRGSVLSDDAHESPMEEAGPLDEPAAPLQVLYHASGGVPLVSPTATGAAATTTLERRIRQQSANAHSSGGGGSAQSPTSGAATPRTKSIVDFFGKHAKKVVPEGETFIPSNELHLYQLFCLNTNMVLIFRPVSPSVPPMYAGNFFVPHKYCDADGIPLMIHEIDPNLTLKDVLQFTVAECRVKGKGIGVSLKSSPYPPIDGFIPVNPSLSKTYSEARRKERALEDNLINAAGGGEAMSTALLRKMRSQRSLFSAATSVAMKEIEASLKDSDQRLKKLLDEYAQQSSYAIDKLSVAEEFIGILNESQFLGKTIATWRGLPIYYKQAHGDADVERRENAHPVFYCLRGDELVVYDLQRNELDNSTAVPLHNTSSNAAHDHLFPPQQHLIGTLYHPVYILTHRSFVISPISKRIEQDPQGDFLIGPDFDGFAYAAHIQTADRATPAQYMAFVEQQMNLRVLPTMGLVNDLDIEHILEMRRLTEWKQSHGYECSNTLKTQDISDGPHVIIMPNEIRIASNFPELMSFYREAWQCGYPLLLNPNWKVVISPVDHLPLTIGDELSLPIVDDCGLAMLKHHLASVGRKFEEVKEEAIQYIDELVGMRRQGVARLRVAGMYSTSLVPRVAIVVARKKLADTFYTLRRWMLMPPLFDSSRLNTFDDDPMSATGAHATPSSKAALARRASTVFTAGKGGKKQVVPVSHEFERFREEKVAALLVGFDEECATFDALFGADDPRFVRRLKQFTDPNVVAQAASSALQQASEDAQRMQRTGAAHDLSVYLAPSASNDPARSSEKGAGLSAVSASRSTSGRTGEQFVQSVDASGERPFA